MTISGATVLLYVCLFVFFFAMREMELAEKIVFSGPLHCFSLLEENQIGGHHFEHEALLIVQGICMCTEACV
jgi:hypothetical protein